MKKLTLFIILLAGAISQAIAQTDSLTIAKLKEEVKREVMAELQAEKNSGKATDDGVKLKLYGFIRNYINYDTRECIALTGELFNILPKDVELNENGEDINATPKAVFVSPAIFSASC